jgi:hypothetical protein
MRRVLSVFKVALLVCLSVLFLFVLIGTLTIGVFDRKLLKEDFYKSQLRHANFYERVYTDVMPEIKDLPSYYGELVITEQERDQLIRKIIPPQWLQEQVESALHSAMPWLRSETEELNVVIDLVPAKQRAGPVVLQFVSQRLTSLPECPLGQEPDLSHVAYGEFPDCLPERPNSAERETLVNQVIPMVTPYISQNINDAPDKVDLVQEAADKWNNGSRERFLDRFHTVRTITDWTINKTGLVLAYLALAVLLLLIALLNVGRLRAMLRWIGGTMLFTSLPLLAMGLYAHFAGPSLVEHEMENKIKDVPASIIKLASGLSGSAIKEISWTFVMPAIVIAGIGMAVFVLSFLVQRRDATRGD